MIIERIHNNFNGDEIVEEELKELIKKNSKEEIYKFVEENSSLLFSNSNISNYYEALKKVNFLECNRPMPILVMAWLSFLRGDHVTLFSLMNKVSIESFEKAEESSTYYALKAMVKYIINSEEGLHYAKLSVDILSEKESFFLGNAKLTYAQLLAKSSKYKEASLMFSSSYKVFNNLGVDFPASVALVNEALNLCKLGEFKAVIELCEEGLIKGGIYKQNKESYWETLYLPLGICYYELNKPSLAIKHLLAVKNTVDKLNLYHMHGLLELYMFRCYYLLKDYSSMEAMFKEASENFGPMHIKDMDILILMFKVLLYYKSKDIDVQPEIEKLELEYTMNSKECNSLVIETLMFLKANKISSIVNIDVLEDRVNKTRYIGNIPLLQKYLLALGELCIMEKRDDKAREYIKEAVKNYKDYGMSTCFYYYPLNSLPIIEELDKNLYNSLSKNNSKGSALLSKREKEIMKLMALGKSNNEISSELFISIGTVKWHINNIFSKLYAKNRVHAIAEAKKLGEI